MAYAGIFLGGPVKHTVSFRTEFTFKVRRQEYSFKQSDQEGSTSAQIIAIQIPALLEVRSKNGIRAMFGPGLEFPLAGAAEATVLNTNTEQTGTLYTELNDRLRSMTVSIILDVGFAFKNGLALGFRTDIGQSNIWKKSAGASGTNITDLILTFEYDINARARQRKASK
jgi:hypothetical protein